MISPKIPANESLRLKGVRQLGYLDSLPQEVYDNITTLASEICESPVALLTILDEDRQWFKSKKGLSIKETPREVSFCGHAILEPNKLFEVENTLEDARFKENPLVTSEDTKFRSYAGVPILNSEGVALGTLCVLNTKEKKLNLHQKKALVALGKQVETLYNFHLKNLELERVKEDQVENNKILKQFASNVSHDLKMPLANIILTLDIFKSKYASKVDEKGMDYLNYVKKAGLNLSDYISSLLDYYSSKKVDQKEYKSFFLNDLLEDIIDLLRIDANCEIHLPERNIEISGHRSAIGQILLNLLSNSLKYNSKDQIIIKIDCEEKDGYYNFSIEDNGNGIPKSKQQSIFKLFTILPNEEEENLKSHGIGLSTVKKLIENMQGTISVKSELNVGSIFTFSIKKLEISELVSESALQQ